ncbi:MAG: fibrobacter succinogenes major paralogous domain-containing protein [Candidatus Symbiothrix sp.]|jgi:hypothetical protein|nr:fibrobacter succinogenes major paralogous domain-containing protein [Candidatus Symbiothrix sp.]
MKTFNFKRLRIKSAMTFTLAVACFLVTGNCSPVTAQVAIGGDGTVTPGALLDLSQATDAGGLLLPQIESADTLIEELKKPGMLVYNKTDGKVYTYNGAAWSVGGGSGGGGGSGPETASCNGSVSVMGVSGTVYPIGSYPYAQNDLKNYCWTLTNLREAGQSYTNFPGQTEDRGYYYNWPVANDENGDICEISIGGGWHLPTSIEWLDLGVAMPSLTTYERLPWLYDVRQLAGYYRVNDSNWRDWGVLGTYWVKNEVPTGVWVRFDSTGLSTTQNNIRNWYVPVRCVRDL